MTNEELLKKNEALKEEVKLYKRRSDIRFRRYKVYKKLVQKKFDTYEKTIKRLNQQVNTLNHRMFEIKTYARRKMQNEKEFAKLMEDIK